MIKRKVISLILCIALVAVCIPTVSLASADGTPWGGEALAISSTEMTTLYAARKNDNAAGSGGSIADTMGGGYNVTDNPEYMDIRGSNAGEWWTYTINVPAAGTYELAVLGTSGWGVTNDVDGGGRFSLSIDGETVVDGNSAEAVILPATGDGSAGGANKKAWYELTAEDKVSLGEVELTAGEQIIKVTIDATGVGYGPIFGKFYFTPVNIEATDGTAWGGTAPTVSANETTTIYAARKNENANCSGGTIGDTMGGGYNVTDNPEYMDIRSKTAGEWWTYTVNVEETGKYTLETLATSGYSADGSDNGGRFSLSIDGNAVVDAEGQDAVVLPAWSDTKGWYQFGESDKTLIGEVELSAGEHIIKVTVNQPGDTTYGMIFGKFYFTPVIEENPGTPYGGSAFVIKSNAKTTLHAAKKNENATGQGAGGAITDTFNDGNTVETAPEKMDIRGKSAGEWWTYTVNVEADGTYAIETLATSGECLSGNDNGSRFTLAIDETLVVDGESQDAIVLPVWNNDKAWYQFTGSDKTALGEVTLTAGEHIIKVIVNVSGDTNYGMIFKEFNFTPVGVELDPGTPYGGSAVNVADGSKTLIYAARKNAGEGMGGTIKDSTGNNYNVENHPEHMDIRGTSPGEWWAYTIDVQKSGLFSIDILGSSGYALSSSQTDAGGRFTLKIDSDVVTDGTGENAVILPAMGEGSENGSNKWWHDFVDSDKVNIGLVYLEEGTHVIKIIVDVPGNTHGILFKRLWLNSVPMLETIIMENSVTIGRGGEKILTYSLSPSKAQAQTVSWSSSDSSACTVDANGKITGVSEGTATVTLSIFDGHQTVTKDCAVTVVVAAESVSLSQTSISLTAGDTVTVTATVLPADTTDKTVMWQSSNTVVAGVNNGVITARAAGSATITATCGTAKSSISVTVTSSGGGSGTSGSGGSGGGGGGGGFKYLPTLTDDKKAQTTNNTYTVADENVQKLDSKTMEKILSTNDTIRYNVGASSLSAEINGEFFTKNPTSKAMVYSLDGGTVEISADALNKAGVGEIKDVKASAQISDNCVKIELSANGKAVSDLNGAVKVKLPADIRKDYTVTLNGSEISTEYIDDTLMFAPTGSGEYDIASKDAAYKDADETAWASDAIYKAVEKNVLQPVKRGSFGAAVSITRGELVSAIVKALELNAEAGTPFEDVSAENKYYSDILVAKTLGIVNGVDGKNFLPDTQITRQDMSLVIHNALKVKGITLQNGEVLFGDDTQISGYAKEAVYLLAGAGFIKGRDTGFAPLANMTRAETAVLLGRICGW